jgi:uncharacterized protein
VTGVGAADQPLGRVFLDTAFVLALLNRRDELHSAARHQLPLIRQAREVWTTEAVLVEIGNALARGNRQGAIQFIESCYSTPNIHVVSVDANLFVRACDLYAARPDKTWGLTDCISFVVMGDHGVTEALTSDEHFEQAGFTRLLISNVGRPSR